MRKLLGQYELRKTPCDPSIQLPDNSPKLDKKDTTSFRSMVGLCVYIARERPDLMFPIKELACAMATSTVAALGHLRKLFGFRKQMGDIGVRLHVPMPAQGKFSSGGACNSFSHEERLTTFWLRLLP